MIISRDKKKVQKYDISWCLKILTDNLGYLHRYHLSKKYGYLVEYE